MAPKANQCNVFDHTSNHYQARRRCFGASSVQFPSPFISYSFCLTEPVILRAIPSSFPSLFKSSLIPWFLLAGALFLFLSASFRLLVLPLFLIAMRLDRGFFLCVGGRDDHCHCSSRIALVPDVFKVLRPEINIGGRLCPCGGTHPAVQELGVGCLIFVGDYDSTSRQWSCMRSVYCGKPARFGF